MAEILINGVRQGWGDIEFMILGRSITGITELSITAKQDKSNEMGQGNLAVHRGRGNKVYEGASVKLYKYEFDAIMDLLPEGKEMTDIAPFTLVAIYTAMGDDRLRKLIIPMTEFTEVKHSPKQGDKSLEIECSLIIGKPVFNKR